jgi:hypothetical protein
MSEQLWIVPAQNDDSFANIAKSIANPISDEAAKLVDVTGPVWAWGAQSGAHDNNVLNIMQAGDFCLFYSQDEEKRKSFHWAARIKQRGIKSPELAAAIWGDRSFELVFLLSDVWPFELSLPEYTEIMGFQNPEMPPRKLSRTSPEPLARILEKFGSVEGWLRPNFKALVPPPPSLTASNRHEKIAAVFDLDGCLMRIRAKGFFIDQGKLAQFYAAIRAKPFVILAGNSGTGKSRLVRLFAEACGATADNGGFHLVAVRPDWSDGGELLGYLDLQNAFRPGQLVEPLLRAHSEIQKPVFVCLDEMNLARVEHYFSDFLSKIESRRRSADGSIVSDVVISARELDLLDLKFVSEPLRETLTRLKSAGQGVCLPPNLIVVGTVNMDETTHAFSRKVLDRANTLEIEAGRLAADLPAPASGTLQAAIPDAIDLTAPFLTAQDMVKDSQHAAALARVAAMLDGLNDILSEANLQVAYRTRDEAAAFFIHATAAGLSSEDAEHAIVMQKILPRVQGSSPRLARILEKLLRRFHTTVAVDANGEKLNEDLLALRRDSSLPPLVRKLASMWLVYQEEGFTSFWVA